MHLLPYLLAIQLYINKIIVKNCNPFFFEYSKFKKTFALLTNNTHK